MRAHRLVIVLAVVACGRVGFNDRGDAGFTVVMCPANALPAIPAGAYWVATDGDDMMNDGLDPTRAWRTTAHAWTVLVPGDTLVVRDGQYPALDVSISGAVDAPITIRAEHDGGAVFDGGGITSACRVLGPSTNNHRSYITLFGMRCQNGMTAALDLTRADHIVARRITVVDGGAPGVANTNGIIVYEAADVLLEDVAAWGRATTTIAGVDSDRVTIRRAYARWSSSADSYNEVLGIAGLRDSIIENPVVTGESGAALAGIAISSPTYYQTTDRNRILGAVTDGLDDYAFQDASSTTLYTDNQIVDAAALRSHKMVFYQRADANLTIDRMTAYQWTTEAFVQQADSTTPKDTGFAIGVHITHSMFVSGMTGMVLATSSYPSTYVHDYNDLFDVTMPHGDLSMPDPTELDVDPGYDTARYGVGAYLIRPAIGIGAEVLERYVDGDLTAVPLWPWPMEDRIAMELGRSVTWDSNGGLWHDTPPVVCQ